jgi:stage II sporulation protein D
MNVERRKICIAIVFFFSCNLLFADDSVSVRIFATKIINTFIFSPAEGSYNIYGDGLLIADCDASGIFQLNIEKDSIHVKTFENDIGKFNTIKIVSKNSPSAFKIKCVTPISTVRMYDDQLLVSLSADKSQLVLVNTVGLESYIAGVVQSESGKSNNIEYYKLQAILCRTYLLAHLSRHVAEGYEVCDDVHCQAYLSRATEKNIMNAVVSTKGLVIVDNNLNLITAAFHSNCGGQTCNSEDVWAISTTYLKAVNDPFCTQKVHSNWEQTITYDEWKAYLKSKGKKDQDSTIGEASETLMIHQANGRSVNYVDGNLKIPFKTIRIDFKLKSAFFSIERKGNNIVFKGRGYGHGVGLCQEGAMEMSKQKYSYLDILHYYYKDVSVVDLRALNYFKQE